MRSLFITCIVIFLVGQFVVISGCANIVPPQGGPRDSIPPVLLRSTPPDSTRNFSGNRLVFTFDEFVDLQGITEQLMISPNPRVNPTVDFRLNTVTVRMRDTLEPNTTYTFNFGDAIRDYTEGNPIKNFTYTFSTGQYIDSLELSGNVILAETGQVDTTLIVMLHTSGDDSAVIRDKPRYITRLDSRGGFTFRNLPPRRFYVYALKDEGGTRRYLNDRQLFAFADQSVQTDTNTSRVTLYAYSAKPAATQSVTTIVGNVNPRGRNQVSADRRLKYQANLNNNQQDLLTDLQLKFDSPLAKFDSTGVILYTDSVFTPVTGYSKKLDSSRKVLTIANPWKENTEYHLVLSANFAEDSTGNKLPRADTISFSTKKLSDYGALKIRLRNLDMNRNPVLQFVLNNVIYRSVPLSSNEFSEAMFIPGDYELRILYDTNRNGVWDPGIFFGQRKQPEIVRAIDRRVTVKSNWQNEFEIQL